MPNESIVIYSMNKVESGAYRRSARRSERRGQIHVTAHWVDFNNFTINPCEIIPEIAIF